MHLLFQDGAAQSVQYASCGASCGALASWPVLTLATTSSLSATAVAPAGLAFDGTGRLHALLTSVPVGSSANRVVYATCAANCGLTSSWSTLDLSTLTGGQSLISISDTLMVGTNGAVSFLTQGTPGQLDTYFLSCSSNCTSLANWTSAAVFSGNTIIARRDGAGVIHAAVNLGSTSAGDKLLGYARCSSSCAAPTNWQVSTLGFLTTGDDSDFGFAVTPSGRVLLAYNQTSTSASPADNGKLFINSCSGSTCTDLNVWTSFTLGEPSEGEHGLWLSVAGESAALISTTTSELHLRTCNADCQALASWPGGSVIDSSSNIATALRPDAASTCPGAATSGAWYPASPVMGLGSKGAVIVHAPYALVQCAGAGSVSRTPRVGRLLSAF